MNNTFKAWLIANMGLFFIFTSTIITILSPLQLEPSIILIFTCLIIGEFIEFPSFFITIIYTLLLLFCLFFLILFAINTSFLAFGIILLFIIISSILATNILKQTRENFYELISRRIQWKTSNIEMFEIKWKYIFNRFIAAFSISFFLQIQLIFCFKPSLVFKF